MQIIIQPAQTVDIDSVVIESVRDLFQEEKIIARVKGLPRGVVLWSGTTEYASASAWTNETVVERATEVLASSAVEWAL